MGCVDIRRSLPSLYYFKVNKRTPEKTAYFDKYRKENSLLYTLFVCSDEQYKKHNFLKNCHCYIVNAKAENISVMKCDTVFKGWVSLRIIIEDFDNVVFLL